MDTHMYLYCINTYTDICVCIYMYYIYTDIYTHILYIRLYVIYLFIYDTYMYKTMINH